MQHFTGVGVRGWRAKERNDASKASRSHVETGVVARRSHLCPVSCVGEGWWDQGSVLGPVDGNGVADRLKPFSVTRAEYWGEVLTFRL